jgi:hypothetical protein
MKPVLLASAILLGLAAAVPGQSNVDPVNKHAWGENVGWTNWRDAGDPPGDEGVNVGAFVMSGFAWGENIGFINLGDGSPTTPPHYANVDGTDFGVNIDPDGMLHGFAWGENVGWINFDGGALAVPAQPARVDCADPPAMPLARLTGYAWGENIGWINLDSLDATKFVALDAAGTPLDCDLNHDLAVNGLDIQFFVDLVMFGGASWADTCSGDLELIPDAMIDFDDVQPFVDCLIN